MKKKGLKRPKSFDTQWLEFLLSEDFHTKQSHYVAMALGYYLGRQRQQYQDSKLITWEYDRICKLPKTKDTEDKLMVLINLQKEIQNQNLVDKFTKG